MPYCENCGKEMKGDALFCENCGTPNKMVQQHSASDQKNVEVECGNLNTYFKGKAKYLVITAGIFLVIFVGVFLGSDSRKYISIVKDGSNEYYDQTTTGEAFQWFFNNVKWKYNTNTKLVEVEGECLYNDIPVKVQMEWYVYDNGTCMIRNMSVDDGYNVNTLTERQRISLLSDIYESAYREKGIEPPANIGDALDGLDFWADYFSW